MSPETLNSEVCANRLSEANASVLALDTCALLDIIRIPVRDLKADKARTILQSAVDVLKNAQSANPPLYIIIPPLVPDEWESNISTTLEITSKHFSKLEMQIDVAESLAKIFNLGLERRTILIRGIDKALLDLSKALLDCGLWLTMNETIKQEATDRAIRNEPPASKGMVKDCIIYGHCLDLFTRLRDQGFTGRIVFISSNTKDFCEPASWAPKEKIAVELNGVEAKFATTWNRALHELGLSDPASGNGVY